MGGPVDSLAVADLQCGSIAVARQWDQGELFRTLRPPSSKERRRVRCVADAASVGWLRLT